MSHSSYTFTSAMSANRYVLTLRRPDRPVQRLELPSLADALEAARADASWLRGLGIVRLSMVPTEAKG